MQAWQMVKELWASAGEGGKTLWVSSHLLVTGIHDASLEMSSELNICRLNSGFIGYKGDFYTMRCKRTFLMLNCILPLEIVYGDTHLIIINELMFLLFFTITNAHSWPFSYHKVMITTFLLPVPHPWGLSYITFKSKIIIKDSNDYTDIFAHANGDNVETEPYLAYQGIYEIAQSVSCQLMCGRTNLVSKNVFVQWMFFQEKNAFLQGEGHLCHNFMCLLSGIWKNVKFTLMRYNR